MSCHVHLEMSDAIAVLTNDNPGTHEAFDDDMAEPRAARAEPSEPGFTGS